MLFRSVRVNAIAPGFIQTPLTDKLPENIKEEARARTALKELGNPDDIAQLILFLTSGAADYITGEVIRVDGGFL